MSLRARLVAGLLLVAAAGLLALAGITYAAQRSFLLDRVDEQAEQAPRLVARLLAVGDGSPGGGPLRRGGPGGGGSGRAGPGPGGPPPDGPGGRTPVGLPPGSYAELRDETGTRVGDPIVLGFGGDAVPVPRLPDELPLGEAVTVGSVTGDARFRVVATRAPFGAGTTVVAVPLAEVNRTLDRLLLVEGVVVALVLVALGAAGWVVVRIGLRPLDRMGETAGLVAGGDLDRRVSPATPRTEVGRLGLALNAMLERLEGAFAQREASERRLRTFLADASHELRTPLASIRGYAELFRMGAVADPGDRARALARIEEEATRMGVLVEDLLALARLDEVRDRVTAPVDLVALARDAVDDARVTAPDRSVTLEAEPGRAVVLGDDGELRQVLGNLVRNALVHTPQATAIEVVVKAHGDAIELVVRDHGPGLPGGDPQALFERFHRAEGGRRRGPGGAGLGLAIVAGVVRGHGGDVTAADAPGGGAEFRVVLPAAPHPGARRHEV